MGPGALLTQAAYIVLMSKRGRFRRVIIVMSGLVFISAIAIQWVPHDSIDRVSQIEVGGLNQRIKLIDLSFISFENHPFGKTRQYMRALDGQNYAHDTILQMLLETGVVGAPILFIIVILAVRGAFKYFRSDPIMSGFMLVLFYFVLQSFSSGSAYNTEFWFSVVFLAALTKRNLIDNLQPAFTIMGKSNSA